MQISGCLSVGCGSYLLHRLRSALFASESVPLAIVIVGFGLVNVLLGIYFYHVLDTQYNKPQMIMVIYYLRFAIHNLFTIKPGNEYERKYRTNTFSIHSSSLSQSHSGADLDVFFLDLLFSRGCHHKFRIRKCVDSST